MHMRLSHSAARDRSGDVPCTLCCAHNKYVHSQGTRLQGFDSLFNHSSSPVQRKTYKKHCSVFTRRESTLSMTRIEYRALLCNYLYGALPEQIIQIYGNGDSSRYS